MQLESFEKKLRSEEQRLKIVKSQIREQNKKYKEKVTATMTKWRGVQGRQSNDA